MSILSAVTIIGTTSVSSHVFAANSSSLGSPNNPITVQLISNESRVLQNDLQNLGSVLTGQLQNLQNNSQTTPSNNSSFQANIFNPSSNNTSNPSSFTSPHFFHSSNEE
ncbi:MAG TPA: hypothetical protein VIY08_15800 [Candidatus Nitrosocosmicus sp.]